MTYRRENAKNGTGNTIQDDHATVASSLKRGRPPADIEKRMFRWRALLTLGGLYGLTLSVLGIVVPLSYFLVLWSEQKFHYLYTFYTYVFLVALIFIVYVSIMTMRLRGREAGEDQNGRPLPSVLIAGEGVNIYLTVAIILFGSASIVMQILIFVAYAEDPLQFTCYGYGQIAISVMLILFVLSQMVFFLGHAKTVFNFKPLLMKLGFIHLMAANMCMWGLAILWEAAESYLQSMGHNREHSAEYHVTAAKVRHARATDSNHSSAIVPEKGESFALECLELNTSVMRASPYLTPFIVEFSLIAVGIVYGMFGNVGTRPPSHPLKLVDNKHEQEVNLQTCAPGSCIFFGHWTMVAFVVGITVVYTLIDEKIIDVGEHLGTVSAGIYFGVQFLLLFVSIIAIIGSWYHTRKCHYVRENPESLFDELLLVISLGGFYVLLMFVIIAASASVYKPGIISLRAQLYAAWAALNYIQASLQVLFLRDGLRRRALMRSTFANPAGRDFMIVAATCNECLWVVMSFMVKDITSSVIMTEYYSSLTWIIISSIFLPLAIFFRFHSGSCQSEVIESLYHGSCFVGNRRLNSKHWEHKE